MRRSTGILGCAAMVIVAIWFVWMRSVRPGLIRARQVSNWALVQTYTRLLEDYHDIKGGYPVHLADAVPEDVSKRDRLLSAQDVYGHTLHYESDGTKFLLVSFGHDGMPDREEYGRRADGAIDDAPCYDLDIDTVYSSDGVRQLCGK